MSGQYGSEHSSSIAAITKHLSLDNLVVVLVGDGIGLSLCTAGGDAFAHEQWRPMCIGFGFGLPLMAIATFFPFLKYRLADWLRDGIVRLAKVGLPVTLLLVVVYMVGPYIFRPQGQILSTDEIADAIIKKLPKGNPQTAPSSLTTVNDASADMTAIFQERDALKQKLDDLTPDVDGLPKPANPFEDGPIFTRKFTKSQASTLLEKLDNFRTAIMHSGVIDVPRDILSDQLPFDTYHDDNSQELVKPESIDRVIQDLLKVVKALQSPRNVFISALEDINYREDMNRAIGNPHFDDIIVCLNEYIEALQVIQKSSMQRIGIDIVRRILRQPAYNCEIAHRNFKSWSEGYQQRLRDAQHNLEAYL